MLKHFLLSLCIFCLLVLFSLFLPIRFWLSFITQPTELHLSGLSGTIFAGTADLSLSTQPDLALTDSPNQPAVVLMHALSWQFTGLQTHQPWLSWTLSSQELSHSTATAGPIRLWLDHKGLHLSALTWHLPLHVLSRLSPVLKACRLSGYANCRFTPLLINKEGLSTQVDAELNGIGSRLVPMVSIGSYRLHAQLLHSQGSWTLSTTEGLPILGKGQVRLNPLWLSFEGSIDIHRHSTLFRPLLTLAGINTSDTDAAPVPVHFVFNPVSR